jgi:hypothetical protein
LLIALKEQPGLPTQPPHRFYERSREQRVPRIERCQLIHLRQMFRGLEPDRLRHDQVIA